MLKNNDSNELEKSKSCVSIFVAECVKTKLRRKIGIQALNIQSVAICSRFFCIQPKGKSQLGNNTIFGEKNFTIVSFRIFNEPNISCGHFLQLIKIVAEERKEVAVVAKNLNQGRQCNLHFSLSQRQVALFDQLIIDWMMKQLLKVSH